MIPAPRLFLAAALGLATIAAAQTPSPRISTPPTMSSALQRIAHPDRSGTAASVRVPDAPLLFTGQIGPGSTSGDAAAQAAGALAALRAVLAANGSDLSRVVRLNAYVADEASVPAVESAVAAACAEHPPAFTLVCSPLAAPGARVVFDAVATTSERPSTVTHRNPHAALLPAGAKLFISGQAERGTDVASAVRLTMAGLHRSLAHLGLKKVDVVQVKAFIKPFADHAAATREIAASFDGGPVPPIVLLEWVSDLFTEIELIASAQSLPAAGKENISYAYLPWLTPSPRYSHVATVSAGTPLIFVGAVQGVDDTDPRAQMKTIFERLGSVLFEAGSSYRNMAKATYYLQDRATRALLGDIRGVYYDPTRAPAASALGVTTLGHRGRAAAVDMIAVPVK